MINLKSNREIDKMKVAGEIVALVLEAIKENAKPGVTTLELDKIAHEIISKKKAIASFKGYQGPAGIGPYPASICASVNEEVVHGIPSSRRLEDKDILSVDVGAYIDGYHGDAARTFLIGSVDKQTKKLVEVTKKSFFNGIKNLKEGNRFGDVSKAVQQTVEKNGFSIVRDFVGHGIGKELHEDPQIPNYQTIRKGSRIQNGMVVAIEPMVNIGDYKVRITKNGWTVVTADGSKSAHYENTVAVTDKGPLILTILN